MDSMEYYCCMRGKFEISCLKRELPKRKVMSQIILFGSLIDYHSNSVFDLLRFHQFGYTALPGTLFEYVWYEGEEENLERSSDGSRP